MEPASPAASTTTFSAAARSPAAGHLGLPHATSSAVAGSSSPSRVPDALVLSFGLGRVLAPPPPVTFVAPGDPTAGFTPLVKTVLQTPATPASAVSPSAKASVLYDPLLVSSPTSPPSGSSVTSYADTVKDARRPPTPRSGLIFKVPSSAMRVSLDNGVSIRASSARASLQDFAEAIFASGIPPRQLSDLSRVGGMVHAYFSDSSWARQLLQTGLAFRDEHLVVLPIGAAPRSVTVSDVPPWVPDFVVKAVLCRYGDVQGRVRTLPASISLPGVGIIRSNRRVADVTFATPAAFAALPPRETITVNGESLVFSFNVPLKCRECGVLGHPAKYCSRRVSRTELASSSSPTGEPISTTPSSVDLALTADRPLAEDLVPSSLEAMDADFGFTVVSPRRKRALSPSSQPSSGAASRRGPSMPPPGTVSKRLARPSKYFHDPVTHVWRDLEGTFSPTLSLDVLRTFIDASINRSTDAAMTNAEALGPDVPALELLTRQTMVFAYTDSAINALPPARRKKYRHDIYRLACRLRDAIGCSSGVSESSTI